jgi:hypothetical protein
MCTAVHFERKLHNFSFTQKKNSSKKRYSKTKSNQDIIYKIIKVVHELQEKKKRI